MSNKITKTKNFKRKEKQIYYSISDFSSNTIIEQTKKPRLRWTPRLENKFLQALKVLPSNQQFPKKILTFMDEPNLKLSHVSSHLQRYRRTKGLHQQNNFDDDTGKVNYANFFQPSPVLSDPPSNQPFTVTVFDVSSQPSPILFNGIDICPTCLIPVSQDSLTPHHCEDLFFQLIDQ